MGIGRGRAALCCILGVFALALVAAGCGAEDHPNDPRPPLPVEVTVSISDGSLSIQPTRVGVAGKDNQPMSQNEGATGEQLTSNAPLTVSFTVSNTTDKETALQIDGPQSRRSPKIIANGTGAFKVELPTGDYSVSATGIPAAQTTFKVGSARTSSQNDLLLP